MVTCVSIFETGSAPSCDWAGKTRRYVWNELLGLLKPDERARGVSLSVDLIALRQVTEN
jgi:hypothetical protein